MSGLDNYSREEIEAYLKQKRSEANTLRRAASLIVDPAKWNKKLTKGTFFVSFEMSATKYKDWTNYEFSAMVSDGVNAASFLCLTAAEVITAITTGELPEDKKRSIKKEVK